LRSRFINQPLSFDALQGEISSRQIVNAKLLAIGIAEIEFGKIAVKVLLAAMLVNSDHATFENRVIALNGIGGDDDPSLAIAVGVFSRL
jgi:hypothetical protein